MESFAIIYVVIVLIIISISSYLGKKRAKSKIRQENRQIKLTNPYQYYKELQNDYGVGIVTLLTDSKIENEKDLIAAILDLCAQKYLHLSKHSDHYVVRLLPNPPKTPLSNEAYILDLIKNHRLKDINYRAWYDYCVADGISLGLFRQTKINSANKLFRSPAFPLKSFTLLMCGVISIALGIVIAIINGILSIFLSLRITTESPIAKIAIGCMAAGFITIIIAFPILLILIMFTNLKSASQKAYHSSYRQTLEQNLTKTPKGISELHKLYAFRDFLNQFRTFVDQSPEAVIIWSRYLSYAQVFGIADQIMQTGYHELIDNADFKIDNIDSISINNISENNDYHNSSPGSHEQQS